MYCTLLILRQPVPKSYNSLAEIFLNFSIAVPGSWPEALLRGPEPTRANAAPAPAGEQGTGRGAGGGRRHAPLSRRQVRPEKDERARSQVEDDAEPRRARRDPAATPAEGVLRAGTTGRDSD